MNDLVFLDTETTGLEPEKHEVWEIAWAVNGGPISVVQLSHSIRTADAVAFEHNGYLDRYHRANVISGREELKLRESFRGATLVCANPTYDRMMLRARWGLEPWHYRSIDVESMAFGLLAYERPQGLKNISDDLREMGYNIPEPNHWAAGDVDALRSCFYALQNYQSRIATAYARKAD